ncbi:hypothetical protein, partial [Streptomyces sp. NPDC096030]|uniref:hypothetical protein n=1 Tax=Streptomyces sp. NPDC096030 TaxID=3155423 RepID=UPI0033181AA8
DWGSWLIWGVTTAAALITLAVSALAAPGIGMGIALAGAVLDVASGVLDAVAMGTGRSQLEDPLNIASLTLGAAGLTLGVAGGVTAVRGAGDAARTRSAGAGDWEYKYSWQSESGKTGRLAGQKANEKLITGASDLMNAEKNTPKYTSLYQQFHARANHAQTTWQKISDQAVPGGVRQDAAAQASAVRYLADKVIEYDWNRLDKEKAQHVVKAVTDVLETPRGKSPSQTGGVKKATDVRNVLAALNAAVISSANT